ncbi:hypothetical protein IQA64_18795 [Leptospira borgpetersenii serovar Tarassovi]|nr:hypothetical protein [Leptospira borgpetersenii serovar Tarassovi]
MIPRFSKYATTEESILIRQNGAPSGLEKRGLASIYHKTKKPTEGTQ